MTIKPLLSPVWIIVAAALVVILLILCIFIKSQRRVCNFRRIGIVVLILGILLRPMINGGDTLHITTSLNIFFVVDNTGSMATRDMDGGKKYRYEVLKDDMKKIVELFPGARYSVIAIDYSIYQMLPVTSSASTAIAAADSIRPRQSAATSRSSLSQLLEFATKRIKAYNDKNPDRSSLIFFMTDGEEADSDETSVPDGLTEAVTGGTVIGYGTDAGGYVHRVTETNDILDDEFVHESSMSDELHVSKLNEQNLKAVADKLALQFVKRDYVAELPRDIENYYWHNARYSNDPASRSDIYWILALAIILLLLWDFADITNKLILERKAVK